LLASLAQSSVTLYGLLDEGFNIKTNAGGKHLYNMSSGVLQGSRWGLRGGEDLGAAFASPFTGQTATFNNGEVNCKYQLTPALLVGAAYDYTRGSEIDGNPAAQYHQGSLGIDYFLSKRTDVYIIGVYQHALGETLNTAGTGITPAVASISNLTPSANQNQLTARVGIRAKF
jgi:predicted porin